MVGKSSWKKNKNTAMPVIELNFTFHLSAGGKVEASLSEELGEIVEEVAIV